MSASLRRTLASCSNTRWRGKVEALLSVLPADGSWVSFDQFMTNARIAGARAELWRRAKQAGKIETRIEGNYGDGGVHQVRLVVNNA